MLLSDLSVPDPVFDAISFAILHAFRSATAHPTNVLINMPFKFGFVCVCVCVCVCVAVTSTIL